jgi:hypothetical protein
VLQLAKATREKERNLTMVALLRSVELNPATEFVVHNSSVGQLIRTDYRIGDLQKIISELERHQTLSILRLPNGASTAVTITDELSRESARGDGLFNAWDRDNIFQAYAELSATTDVQISNSFKIEATAWQRGLTWSLWHHAVNQDRFIRILEGSAPADGQNYPAVRVDPETGFLPAGPWNHKQHDALGMVLHLLFWQLNEGHLSWANDELKAIALPYATLLFSLFDKVGVWNEPDDSAWEFHNTALHLSSMGIVVMALEELLHFVNNNGPLDYLSYKVTAENISKMIENCKLTLQSIGTAESIWSGGSRQTDLAQLNALVLQAVSNRSLFAEDLVAEMLTRIETSLVGQHGVRRFIGDIWNGRWNDEAMEAGHEAQWTIGAPMMSVVFGWLYRRTAQLEFLEKQQHYFSLTLAGIDADWRLPEAYILDKNQMKWVADENKPLAWSQSMCVLALTEMKSTLMQA